MEGGLFLSGPPILSMYFWDWRHFLVFLVFFDAGVQSLASVLLFGVYAGVFFAFFLVGKPEGTHCHCFLRPLSLSMYFLGLAPNLLVVWFGKQQGYRTPMYRSPSCIWTPQCTGGRRIIYFDQPNTVRRRYPIHLISCRSTYSLGNPRLVQTNHFLDLTNAGSPRCRSR